MNKLESVQAGLAASFRASRVVFESLHENADSFLGGWYVLNSDKGAEWSIIFWGEPESAINLAWKIGAPHAMKMTVVAASADMFDAYNDAWHVEMERVHSTPVERAARENRFSTMNRAWAHELACFFSREGVAGCVGKVMKWARIRTIYEAGWVVKEFKDVPYTNGPADWND